jgi:hypothetical protein
MVVRSNYQGTRLKPRRPIIEELVARPSLLPAVEVAIAVRRLTLYVELERGVRPLARVVSDPRRAEAWTAIG